MSISNSLLRKEQNRRAYLRKLARQGKTPNLNRDLTEIEKLRITYETSLIKFVEIAHTKYGMTTEEIIHVLLGMEFND